MEWKPIETVPKDGTAILVYFPTIGVREVYWEDNLWCVDDNRNGPYALRGYGYNEASNPTHWMNKPEPPKD